MLSISHRIEALREEIAAAAAEYGRDAQAIHLLAASKARSAEEIRLARRAGIEAFGENYVQEALAKMAELTDPAPCWHMIGPVQSNKTRDIARHFDWVQTLDRARIAERLARQRPPERGPLDVLIQVNIDGEPQKAGVEAGALAELIAVVTALPQLRLRGLMTIPEPDSRGRASRGSFERMALLFRRCRAHAADYGIASKNWDTLSMGMTKDFRLAIAEGATMLRIGTAIFGARPSQ